MKAAHAALLSAVATHPVRSPGMRWQHGCLVVTLLILLAVYLPTASTIVSVWWRSPTFNHGFLILPVAGWLIWRQRLRLAGIARQPWRAGLMLVAALGAAWMLAAVANVQVLQQYCLVLMCIVTVVTLYGTNLASAIAFPLAYTLLAVPFGEIFMPPLIDFTAHFTVTLLKLAGIPVFQENNYIALTTGNWSVAEACSGLRYLVASLALGMLYACINYQSMVKRLIFIGISLLLPILANGLRACMVVLIGHWSDMKLAAGVDHLVYGWLFFGAVMTVLFCCGAYWRDAEPPLISAPGARPMPQTPPKRFIATAIAIVGLGAIWPPLAAYILRPPLDDMPEQKLSLAPPAKPWRASRMRAGDWHMLHRGAPQRIAQNYSDGQRVVSLQLTWYRHQTEGAELLAPVRRTVVAGAPQWEEVSASRRKLMLAGRELTVRQSIQQAAHYKLLVWRWYRQGEVETASPQMLKLLLAKAKLTGDSDAGAEIIIASAYDEQPVRAEAAMRALLTTMLPAIDQGLAHVNR
ncbi:exosortase A [Duganella sp. sic0402]|uniref:exosortase A n=1 Tax=Duganella sp. sic0402 TaxID=2854786 RepID=UPI001C474971|nr:exosortase A [Duganella sp. sic0402]MBV7534760.1 exosortase A [Duganella sp. sic0402]